MKVVIGSYTICDGIDESPSNLQVSEDRETQIAKGTRWKQAKVFDRKNKETSVTFEIHRVHATLGDAEKFVMVHGTQVPNNGLVTFTMFDGVNVYLDSSQCKAINVSHTGISTRQHYTIIGGEMRVVGSSATARSLLSRSSPVTSGGNLRIRDGKMQMQADNLLWYDVTAVIVDDAPELRINGAGVT